MPWTASDAEKHTKKAATDKLRRQWAAVANSALKRCIDDGGDTSECEVSAIKQANSAIAEAGAEPGGPERCICPECGYEVEKERGVPCRSMECPECGVALIANVEEVGMSIAQQAIEMARAVVNDSKMLAQIAEAKGVSSQQAANRMLDELERELAEAATKTVDGKKYPASDFLVVEDPEKSSTFHLQVKRNGKPDHNLMGAARAALTVGYRGNKYEGPGKADALKKLKALYKAEEMEWSEAAEAAEYDAVSYVPGTIVSFAGLQAVEQAQAATAQIRDLTYQFQELVGNIMFSFDVPDKVGTLRALTDEFADLVADKIGDVGQAATNEAEVPVVGEAFVESVGGASGVEDYTGDLAELGIEAAIETGRRAPVLVDFQVIKPGPGNKKDNHYYPADMLRRDAGVFAGVDIFATDHKEAERSERTKVGRVQACPVRFTEDGAPVAQVIIYDPAQAEKTRNRADAGELATMECSIFARGISEAGEIGGEKYKIVKHITEGKYLELVSSAGAGGHALSLAESANGGDDMKVEGVTDEQAEVEEVEIQEAQEPVEDSEQQERVEETEESVEESNVLAESEVSALLEDVRLPERVKALLRLREYADEAELGEAVGEMVEAFKSASGSGKPAVTRGASSNAASPRRTLAEVKAAQNKINKRYLGTRYREEAK